MPGLFARFVVTLGIVTLVAGCGEGGGAQGTVEVSGTVTLDGEPVEGVEVSFLSEDFAGYGTTNAEGKYELVQGAVPGQNKVVFSKLEGGDGLEMNPEEGMDEGQLEAMGMDPEAVGPKQLIPEKYSDPEQSKITFNVPEEGTTSANFKLTTN